MIKPSERVHVVARALATTQVDFLQWLQEWRSVEMERLPSAPLDKVQIAQGRCQVLTELCNFVQNAPNKLTQP